MCFLKFSYLLIQDNLQDFIHFDQNVKKGHSESLI